MVAIILKIIILIVFITTEIQTKNDNTLALYIGLYFVFYLATSIWPPSYMLWVHHRTFKLDKEMQEAEMTGDPDRILCIQPQT